MATKLSTFTQYVLTNITGDCAGEVVANDYFIDLKAADIVLNDVVDIGILPANHTIVDAMIISDDLDTNATPTLSVDVGLMSGVPGDDLGMRTTGNELFAGDTAAGTGGVSRMTKKTGFTIQPTVQDRSIGVKFAAAAATPAPGRFRLRVLMASKSPENTY